MRDRITGIFSQPPLPTTPGEDRGYSEITDDGARHARQPPSMARGERIGRYPDIGNSPDSADQVEEGKPAQQGQTAQSLVAISKLIIQEEIRSHRHQRG